jgi:hypothetical protein
MPRHNGEFRHYLKDYAHEAAPLHDRKKALLKVSPIKGAPRRAWSARSVLNNPSEDELLSFQALQDEFKSPRPLELTSGLTSSLTSCFTSSLTSCFTSGFTSCLTSGLTSCLTSGLTSGFPSSLISLGLLRVGPN